MRTLSIIKYNFCFNVCIYLFILDSFPRTALPVSSKFFPFHPKSSNFRFFTVHVFIQPAPSALRRCNPRWNVIQRLLPWAGSYKMPFLSACSHQALVRANHVAPKAQASTLISEQGTTSLTMLQLPSSPRPPPPPQLPAALLSAQNSAALQLAQLWKLACTGSRKEHSLLQLDGLLGDTDWLVKSE